MCTLYVYISPTFDSSAVWGMIMRTYSHLWSRTVHMALFSLGQQIEARQWIQCVRGVAVSSEETANRSPCHDYQTIVRFTYRQTWVYLSITCPPFEVFPCIYTCMCMYIHVHASPVTVRRRLFTSTLLKQDCHPHSPLIHLVAMVAWRLYNSTKQPCTVVRLDCMCTCTCTRVYV